MRIKKIKLTKESKIQIAYEKLGNIGWDEYSLTCSEAPRPELYTAITALAPHVIEMCELPEDYLPKINVRSVSFSYGGEKEVMGATISSQMKLEHSNCDLNLNTPHKASESYSDCEADPNQLLSGDCVDALINLCDEAELYIKGDRAQGKLFAVS